MKGITITKINSKVESIKFAKRTEEAWKRYEKGKFKSLPMDKFLKELKKC